jgi:adenylosuccinate lyase
MAAVRKGVGREIAHEAIKEHAVSVALAMRELAAGENDLLARLAADSRLQLSLVELQALIAEPLAFTGAAGAQVKAIAERISVITTAYPAAAAYTPGDIL